MQSCAFDRCVTFFYFIFLLDNYQVFKKIEANKVCEYTYNIHMYVILMLWPCVDI